MQILTCGVKPETNGRPASRRAVTLIAGSLLIITALFFAGCTDCDCDDAETTPGQVPTAASPATASAPSTPSAPSKGLIKADPNPVPAGPGELGKTTISWNTQTDEGPVQITVLTEHEEVGFSGGAKEGSTEAPWIQSSAPYDFRLWVGTGANRKMIDHVVVTRNK